MTTTDDYISNLVNQPVHDWCPSWCVDSFGEGGSRIGDCDDHDGLHSTKPYAPSGSNVFANLQRRDRMGDTPGPMKPEDATVIVLTAGSDDSHELRLSMPEARSLARILTHLADLEEL